MRPRLKVPETAAILAAFLVLFTTPAGNAAATRHDHPVPILMYHLVAPAPTHAAYRELFVRPADFDAQMHWLAEHGYHAVTLHRVYEYWLLGAPLPEKPVVVSFDDGSMGQHLHALPTLRKLHWPGVLNLKVDALESKYTLPAWRVREMLAAGWELDSHTIAHSDLTRDDDAQLWQGVHQSRVELQRMFHVPVEFFCYPAGRYDARVIAAVRRAGYLGATTTAYGLARPADIYTLNRIRIDGSDGLAGFASKLQNLTG